MAFASCHARSEAEVGAGELIAVGRKVEPFRVGVAFRAEAGVDRRESFVGVSSFLRLGARCASASAAMPFSV